MQTGLPFPNISPEVFSISLGGIELALRWYALAYIAGILIGWRIAAAAMRRPALWPADTPPTTPAGVEQYVTWIIFGIILGGRIGYVLFYQPALFLSEPWRVIAVWEGGMSFHGGFLGVVVATWLWARQAGAPIPQTSDFVAMSVPPGLLLGRLANFVNAELWGRPTDLPWGVIFPGEAAQACATATAFCARHPSQLYEALLEGVILGGLLLWMAFRGGALERPLTITGTFLAGYGIARFLVEFVRQPDAQFVSPGNPLGLAWEVGGYGLTMGQLLSLPMILVGVALLLMARRRPLPA